MRPRGAQLLGGFALVVACAEMAARAEETTRYGVRAEIGAEVDTNAHRTEVIAGATSAPTVASPLTRVVVAGNLADMVTDNQDIALSLTGAGKVFLDEAARGEDVAVAQSSARWRAALGARTRLMFQAVYYEAFQRHPLRGDDTLQARDFRSLTPALRLTRSVGRATELGATAGYRAFVFKPDRTFAFDAATAGLDARWTRETDDGGAEWDLSVAAAAELRRFGGPRLLNLCQPPSSIGTTCPPSPTLARRDDQLVIGQVELTRTAGFLAGLGYAIHFNRSNSFGETVLRHFVTARATARLPLEVYLALRAEVLVARYADPVIVGQDVTGGRLFVSIEDENRSSVRADVSRALTDRLQALFRYTFYANELGAARGAYRRHTALLSLVYAFER